MSELPHSIARTVVTVISIVPTLLRKSVPQDSVSNVCNGCENPGNFLVKNIYDAEQEHAISNPIESFLCDSEE